MSETFSADTTNLLLVALGTAIAALTFLVVVNYQIASLIVENLVRRETQRVEIRIRATSDYEKGLEIWDKEVDKAIVLTQRAIDSGGLEGEGLIMAKSSLAFYLASKPFERAKARAFALAEETLNKSFTYPNSTNILKINYGYVLMKYSETPDEIQDAINFLNTLLGRGKMIGEISYESAFTKPLFPHQVREIEEYIKEANGKFSLLSQ